MRAHLEDLRAEVQDDELVDAFAERPWRELSLPESTRTVLELAEKVARDPAGSRQEDLEPVRRLLGDEGVLDVVLVVSLFQLYNTVADALGVDDEPEWGTTQP